eukprot:TRINITY_DN7548_c0_g2_i1.p1 TRINITY_DN7548_c0_g2~~TRINITY_DN7548_c0_g2_i1.p1  ORF type:complete len:749 (+),score=159.04 TRINITY_DN7548_c0_g2_i1:170-2416(+)
MAPGLGPSTESRAGSKERSHGAASVEMAAGLAPPVARAGGKNHRRSVAIAAMGHVEMMAQLGPLAAAARDRARSRLDSDDGSLASSRRNSIPKAVSDDDVAWRAACELKEFVVRKEGSSLRAWTKYFDTVHDQRIGQMDFIRGMRAMNYPGDAAELFWTLDADRSGELALEELDANAADQWRQFRAFCVHVFDDPTDMLKPAITENDLKWLDQEQKRQKRKEAAKKRALIEKVRRKDNNWKLAEATMKDFKQFLKHKYGNYVRAWRSALSPEGSMVLQRAVLFKACANLGWQGDVRLLYKAFDKDDSGYISIEELDAHAAELLAHFHEFIGKHFGSASAAFKGLDTFNQKKIKQPEFCAALKSFGFQYSAKAIFQGLDYEGKKALNEEDLLFLDRWKPHAFLTRAANPQAMEEFKQLLLKAYKNFLKAWRHLLDSDSSNRCNYDEFEASCKKLKFKGDVPGAWRALDEDLSGCITLHEIDPTSSETLKEFRKWCDQEFGGVRSAFGVFDTSGDDEVTYREWRRALRIYGFTGNASTLFYALDVEKNGSLSVDEVDFLDDWIFPEASDDALDDEPSVKVRPTHSQSTTQLTQYVTDAPGPGTYNNVSSTVGAGPLSPMLKFSGAFSFRGRIQGPGLPGVQHDSAYTPAPVDYDDLHSLAAICPSKPSWGFGTEIRKVAETSQPDETPGPGQYSPVISRTATAVTCTPRRALKVHPLFRDLGAASPRNPSYSPRKERSEAVTALPSISRL